MEEIVIFVEGNFFGKFEPLKRSAGLMRETNYVLITLLGIIPRMPLDRYLGIAMMSFLM